ncbi:hypothetical protein [Haloterrigena gelatinilytica]|uniref:hypothetical protein n=1 Tax=Haloterrigena gelatinilytica TaxID=2741724 RepID=UPI0028126A8A|nr:hypothetical protein [Haloterrigena gelatinilytica]
MKRRTILATTGSSVGCGLAGCLGSDAPSDSSAPGDDGDPTDDGSTEISEGELERCHLVSVDYESLPDAIRAEVDAVLEDGRYESDALLFDDAVDPERSFLVVDDAPYDPRVDADGGTATLELEPVDVVRLPEPAVISVSNGAERDHDVRVELTADDGETVVDETVSLEPGETCELEATDAFGSYELTARALTGHEATDEFEFRIGDSHFDGVVAVSDDGLSATQSVADTLPCPWDVRYS